MIVFKWRLPVQIGGCVDLGYNAVQLLVVMALCISDSLKLPTAGEIMTAIGFFLLVVLNPLGFLVWQSLKLITAARGGLQGQEVYKSLSITKLWLIIQPIHVVPLLFLFASDALLAICATGVRVIIIHCVHRFNREINGLKHVSQWTNHNNV